MGSNCQGVPEGRGTPGGGLRLCSERARSRQLGDLWGGRGGGEGQGTGVEYGQKEPHSHSLDGE